MAKLYFRHGAMGSAKTLRLLAVARNYRNQGKRVMIGKPAVDDRYGPGVVESRAGLRADADLVIDEDTDWLPSRFKVVDCVLVDEAQFLPVRAVEELRRLTADPGIPVICYGLRTDFRTRLFPASARLMELADSIEEVKTTCHKCNRKAILNMRHLDGEPTLSGGQVQIGGDETYAPVCFGCYFHRLGLPRSPSYSV